MPVSSTVAGAVDSGLAMAQLSMSPQNPSLDGASAGTPIHVDSADPSSPSYELVDLARGGHTLAVAKVNDVSGGFQLGSIQWVTDSYKPLDSSNRSAIARSAGLDGPTRLVWAMSESSWSPFAPLVDVTTAGGHRYVGPTGVGAAVR